MTRFADFLAAREHGISLALVRIALGLTVFATLANNWLAGVVDAVWIDMAHGGIRPLSPGWLISFLGGATPEAVNAVICLTMVSATAMVVGFSGRFATFVTLQGYLALTGLNGHAGGSYDELLTNGLWLSVLGGGYGTLSLDCWIRSRKWTSDLPAMRWPRFLMVVQIVLMYGTTGWQKLSTHWVPGGDLGALYYIYQQPTWQRFDMTWLAPLFPLTQLATLTAWLWEVSAPVWLWLWLRSLRRPGGIARLRWVYLAMGVAFHVSVEAFMEIGPFSAASLALYPALIHPREWRALWARLTGSRGSSPAPAASST